MCSFLFFYISHVTLQLPTLPTFVESGSPWARAPQPFTLLAAIKFAHPGSPLIVSGRRSLFCLLNPAGVFLGILKKTLAVDPGMTPVQFQACEELHSLELSLISQCQEFSWSLRQAIRDCWRRRWYRAVGPSYTTRREAGDKRGADTLNMEQILFFFLCQLQHVYC